MSKNRDRLRLIAAVLEAVSTGTTKTRIMYKANLSFKLLEKYLETTIANGFVQRNGKGYKLTEKGQKFLNQYRNFDERHSKTQKIQEALTSERALLGWQCQENTAKTPKRTTETTAQQEETATE